MDISESFFSENYDLIFSSGVWSIGTERKVLIGEKENKLCRFCGKDESSTSFNNVSHAIPESLGNKTFIALEECDTCNEEFAQGIEDSLDKYLKPYRTLAHIKGKKKIPTTKSRDKKSRLDVNEQLIIQSPEGSGFYSLDIDNKKLKLKIDREPYIPCDVYKAFMKIAMSVVKDKNELSAFRYTIAWIMHKNRNENMLNPLKVWQTFIPGHRTIGDVSTMLFRIKSSDNYTKLPYSIFILGISNYIYQMIVPSHLDVNESGEDINFHMPFLPTIFDQSMVHGKPTRSIIDLTGSEKTYDEVPILIMFKSIGAVTDRSRTERHLND